MKREELFAKSTLSFRNAAGSLISSRNEGTLTKEARQILEDLLSEPQMESVLKYLTLQRVAAGETLWEEGDTELSLALILSGRVSLLKETEIGGKQVVVGVCSPVTLVGEIEFVDGRPRAMTARALVDTEVVVLPRENFSALVSEAPKVGERITRGLLQLLATRLRTSHERIAAIF